MLYPLPNAGTHARRHTWACVGSKMDCCKMPLHVATQSSPQSAQSQRKWIKKCSVTRIVHVEVLQSLEKILVLWKLGMSSHQTRRNRSWNCSIRRHEICRSPVGVFWRFNQGPRVVQQGCPRISLFPFHLSQCDFHNYDMCKKCCFLWMRCLLVAPIWNARSNLMTAESELALRLELLVMRVSLQDIECTGNLQREGCFSRSFMQLQATEVRSVCVILPMHYITNLWQGSCWKLEDAACMSPMEAPWQSFTKWNDMPCWFLPLVVSEENH